MLKAALLKCPPMLKLSEVTRGGEYAHGPTLLQDCAGELGQSGPVSVLCVRTRREKARSHGMSWACVKMDEHGEKGQYGTLMGKMNDKLIHYEKLIKHLGTY